MGMRFFLMGMIAALALTPGMARASAIYPALIQQDLGATCMPEPACTICHRDLNGGTGTVVTPFGRAMMGLGLVAESPIALKSALAQEKAANADSDHDGDTDVDALLACRDPNQGYVGDGGVGDGSFTGSGAPGFTDPTPEYGCALGRAGQEAWAGWVAAVGALTALALRRRRPAAHET